MNITLNSLVSRHIKLYFRDKSTFLTSLISPMILLVLFVTFLGGVYKSSFLSIIPDTIQLDGNLVDSFTLSWLLSSLLGVSTVTVAFCSNTIMAQDKANGISGDFLVAPIKKSTLAISYFISNVVVTSIVCFAVTIIGLIYIATIGWYFTVLDVIKIFAAVILCVLFGTSLAALFESFISSQGGVGAVATLVSSLYGFLCGAYMPISQFSKSIANFISFLPGTYATSILRNLFIDASLTKISDKVPDEAIKGIRDGFDLNLYFFDNKVSNSNMYIIVGVTIVVVLAAYIILTKVRNSKRA